MTHFSIWVTALILVLSSAMTGGEKPGINVSGNSITINVTQK